MSMRNRKISNKTFMILSLKIRNSTLKLFMTKKDFKCDISKKNFREMNDLKTHILFIHDFRKKHVCKICNNRFSKNRI